MKKDKSATIRINSAVLEAIKKEGDSVQKIVDRYVEKNFSVEEESKTRVKKRK